MAVGGGRRARRGREGEDGMRKGRGWDMSERKGREGKKEGGRMEGRKV